MNNVKYFEKFDLTDNPFYSEPIDEFEESPKGFISRDKYIEKISMLLDDGKGYLKIVGDVGSGKTSLLKRAKFLARKKDYVVIEIDASKNYSFMAFYSQLIAEFMKTLKNNEIMRNLEINEYHHLERAIMQRIGKIKEQFSTQKVEKIRHTLAYLEDLFSKAKCLVVADDSDKLSIENFKKFMVTLESMPKNVVFVSTAHPIHLTEGLIPQVQTMYDHYLTLEPIHDAQELSKYINGRIINYSKGEPRLLLGRPVFDVLFERTKGNLRETFRYLRTLFHFISMEQFEYPELTDSHIKNIIKEEDSTILKALKPLDRAILSILSSNSKNELKVSEITKKVNAAQHKQYPEYEIRKRLDHLSRINIVFKKQVSGIKPHKFVYFIPKILSEVLAKEQ